LASNAPKTELAINTNSHFHITSNRSCSAILMLLEKLKREAQPLFLVISQKQRAFALLSPLEGSFVCRGDDSRQFNLKIKHEQKTLFRIHRYSSRMRLRQNVC